MSHPNRIALALAAAVLFAAAAQGAEAQSRQRPTQVPVQGAQIQSVQVAPAPPQVAGGVVAAPQVPVGTPTLAQLGSSSAYVPMKHGSAGTDASTHVLANRMGNLDMKLKAGMTCPDDRTVIHVSAKPVGANAVTFVGANTGDEVYSANVTMQPFSANELEVACQKALGGAWATPGDHNNATQSVKKTISKKIEVWGQCSGWANKAKRTYTVLLTLTCDDKSWFVPVG
jgi:hypothetical protein